jgi:hypothetical protein
LCNQQVGKIQQECFRIIDKAPANQRTFGAHLVTVRGFRFEHIRLELKTKIDGRGFESVALIGIEHNFIRPFLPSAIPVDLLLVACAISNEACGEERPRYLPAAAFLLESL